MSKPLQQLQDHVLDALRKVLPQGAGTVPLHEPSFEGNEWRYVKECLDTGWVSSAGSFVDRFETMLRDITAAAGVVAVVNGTCGLHACLVLAGVKPGEEVLVPALTFVGTANAAAAAGAIPHFVEIEEQNLGVDPAALREHLCQIGEKREDGCCNRLTGRRIAAIIPVHLFGHSARIEEINAVCLEFGIEVIEDAAEALGSFLGGKHVGLSPKLGVLSFNGNKTLTTGGGGAIISQDLNLSAKAKHITSTARQPHPYKLFHDQFGFNYRMPNINAALGLAQLEMLPEFLARKRALASSYSRAFAGMEEVRFLLEPQGARSNYWLNGIVLKPEYASIRDSLIESLLKAGYQVRPAWTLLNKLPMYADCPRMELSCAERIESGLINLPSGPKIIGD